MQGDTQKENTNANSNNPNNLWDKLNDTTWKTDARGSSGDGYAFLFDDKDNQKCLRIVMEVECRL